MRSGGAVCAALILIAAVRGEAAGSTCLEPLEPLSFRLERSDPLYPAALEEHRRYLEAMEDYVNCIDRERFVALSMLRQSFQQFNDFFGEDARFEYDADGNDITIVPDG